LNPITEKKWVEKIISLIKEPETSHKMGEERYKVLEEKYNQEIFYQKQITSNSVGAAVLNCAVPQVANPDVASACPKQSVDVFCLVQLVLCRPLVNVSKLNPARFFPVNQN
jgi:hypothetical protein